MPKYNESRVTDTTVDELREKLSTAVDEIIDQFQDQIDNLDLP